MSERAAAENGEAVVSVRGLCFRYGRESVLEGVDLDIHECDFLALIGPNGGGKTTLLKLLLGLLEPAAGTIRWRLPAAGGRRGYVPQFAAFDAQFPLRVSDVVRMGRLGRRDGRHRYSRADDVAVRETLERLGLRSLERTPLGELSGGQRQRVLIARALVSDPEILFLDEPTASIDPDSREGLLELLRELNRSIPIVVVTHDLGSLPDTVKNVACLNRSLYYHPGSEIDPETLDRVYGCHVDLIAHGRPHRVLQAHGDSPETDG